MKIVKIEREGSLFTVYREPNWLESLFGCKSRVDKYKDTGYTYMFGGGNVYVNQKGIELGNSMGYGCNTREALDRFRRSF